MNYFFAVCGGAARQNGAEFFLADPTLFQ